jgi:hypothetical protein
LLTLPSLLLAVAALVSVGVFWAAVAAWHAAKRQLFPYATHYRPRIVLSVVLVFFYLYPSVTNVAVSLFTCAMVDDPNKPPDHALWAPTEALVAPGLRWSGDTNVVCWEGTHLWLTVGIALPQYILISLGFPLVLVWLLYKRRMVLGLRLVRATCCSIQLLHVLSMVSMLLSPELLRPVSHMHSCKLSTLPFAPSPLHSSMEGTII